MNKAWVVPWLACYILTIFTKRKSVQKIGDCRPARDHARFGFSCFRLTGSVYLTEVLMKVRTRCEHAKACQLPLWSWRAATLMRKRRRLPEVAPFLISSPIIEA